MTIRPATATDVDRLFEINCASTPAVGDVTRDAFDALVEMSSPTLVVDDADRIGGFVICLVEGAAYGSLNYKWLSQRYDRFGYVDRIAVAPEARNRGLGATLYQAVFDHFAPSRPCVVAEVNLEPPNPGSRRFHARLGFGEVGERWSDDGDKGVVYVHRALP